MFLVAAAVLARLVVTVGPTAVRAARVLHLP
jgi:hypothetical protein